MTCSCGGPLYARGMCKRCYEKWRDHNLDKVRHKIKFRGRWEKRECLNCGANFMSEGPHNRRCSQCRAMDDKIPPIVVYEVRP